MAILFPILSSYDNTVIALRINLYMYSEIVYNLHMFPGKTLRVLLPGRK